MTYSPSAFQVERAMSAAQSFAAQLMADNPETDRDDLALALDSETDVVDVLRRVIRSAMEAEAFEDAVAARIEALNARKARFAARAAAARSLALAMMEALDIPKMAEPDFTASIGKPRQKVIVTDASALPAAFVRTTTAPDMATISAAAKAGQMPPGCTLSNGAASLTIRSK